MIHRLLRKNYTDHKEEMIWLTVYADLITNLALVFLALYGLAVMGDAALMEALNSMKLGPVKLVDVTKEELEFEDYGQLLKSEFKQQPEIFVSDEADLVRVEFGEKILFESGDSTAKETALPLLKSLSDLLRDSNYTIVVEGHTDDRPLRKGSRYKDNRELSMARAMEVVQIMIEEGQVEPQKIAAAAYGEQRPRASNLTPSGRRLNRRVEVVIVKDFPIRSEIAGLEQT